MDIVNLKQEYNELILREAKAEAYLSDNTKPIAEREQWCLEFKKIIDRLGEIMSELETNGVKMTEDEIWGGFNLEEGENE